MFTELNDSAASHDSELQSSPKMTRRHPSKMARNGHQAIPDKVKAHTLLVELMAHQFAFPVQWIDTQEELLNNDKNVERIVEIGPAKVLASMAQKTSSKLAAEKGSLKHEESEFLFFGNEEDGRKVKFEYDRIPVPSIAGNSESTVSSSSMTGETSISHPLAKDTTFTASTTEDLVSKTSVTPISAPSELLASFQEDVADVDLSPTDVVLAIVAQKFRKSFNLISLNDSIRKLSGGKSVLQNEIIGDLLAEFDDLPPRSEDLPISELGSKLAASGYSGKLGKSMKKLLGRLIVMKMPAGFTQDEAEKLLQARWGLGPNRRTALLCLAVTLEPTTRMGDADEVGEFLKSVIGLYRTHTGLSVPERSATRASGSMGAASTVQVDAASLDALKKDQDAFLKRQFQLLASHLNIDVEGSSSPSGAQPEELSRMTEELSNLQAELEDEFMLGVRGIFDPKKQRIYASWWNWVREDLCRLIYARTNQENAVCERLAGLGSPKATAIQIDAIANRWDSQAEKILKYAVETGSPLAKAIDTELQKNRSMRAQTEKSAQTPLFRFSQPAMSPRTAIDEVGEIHYSEVERHPKGYLNVLNSQLPPHIHLRSRENGAWQFNSKLTQTYLSALSRAIDFGITFTGRTALIIGAGPGSIGSHLVQGFLAGGAKVIVTTNRAASDAAEIFAQMYKEHGAHGSELIVCPFNAASAQDCQDLISHIYDGSKGLDADLDFVVPFAAVPENGRELDNIDGRSELAHRAMLVNLVRLLGYIKQAKEQRRIFGRPATVILPLSPNHGDFGGDGLYSESKLGLETLFNRFHSESWSNYLSVVGAVIGWTRGTGLMNGNDVVAQGIEDLGVLTFTTQEMAVNILTLLSPKISMLSNYGPVYADLSGGLLGFENLKERISSIRADIQLKKQINHAISEERARFASIRQPIPKADAKQAPQLSKPRSNIRQDLPRLSSYSQMTKGLANLRGMVDLSRTVVIVGFSELGPWGSSRTRWQMETEGRWNQEGYTEIAWITGLIKYGDGVVVDGEAYHGWLDKETGKPVHEADIESRYGERIKEYAGIRMIKSSGEQDYDPSNKEALQEIVLQDDLAPFEASEAVAESFQLRHKEKVIVHPTSSKPDAPWTVSFKKGATFLIPKTVPFRQIVGGQVPDGWDPLTYGIPEDVITQVDPVTLYALCGVCEATYSAGIADIYELYKYIHVSELGNYIGSGAGALKAMQAMYRTRYKEEPVQSDIMQETFLNSMAAWVNMLLLGSTGPIKTPVGACATAVESLDTACESIQGGQIKAAFVGGVDDFGEEVSSEFDSMKATVNVTEELAKGRIPSEMSRPTSASRAGFMEAAGAGVQLIMSAELALKMGLPIRSIIACSRMSGDGISRSLPAPGKGVLTAAREQEAAAESTLLDLESRRAFLKREGVEIEKQRQSRLMPTGSTPRKQTHTPVSAAIVNAEASRRIQDTQYALSSNLRALDPSISPLRAALSAWGLSIDDITVASFHGTSTKANDINESQLINDMMRHLGRAPGNPLYVVCQKSLTGHPKAAAAAWQLNGICQMIESSIVPGNRNADDIEPKLREFEHLVFPSAKLELGWSEQNTNDNVADAIIKACILTSFGFGQKGGIVVAVSPRLLFTALSADEYARYREKVGARRRVVDRQFQLAMMGNSVVKPKEHSAWVEAGKNERDTFLDPRTLR